MAPKTTRMHIEPSWRRPDWERLPRAVRDMGAGRGPVTIIAHPKGPLLQRDYLRGGALRRLGPSLFARTDRPAREFKAHKAIYQAGVVHTARPVGWREEATACPFLFRYFYYTEYLQDAVTLPRYLAGKGPTHGLAMSMARALCRLYRHGIFHTDLNLNNWIVYRDLPYLIDFDKADVQPMSAEIYLNRCVRRMIRSGKKLGFLETGRRAFFRFLLAACHDFELNARKILQDLPAHIYEIRFYHELRWKLAGGRRGQTIKS